VVNYLLKIGDHTTPPWDDISLTNVGRAAVVSAAPTPARIAPDIVEQRARTKTRHAKSRYLHSATKIQICQDQFPQNPGFTTLVGSEQAAASILNLSPAKGRQRIAQGVQPWVTRATKKSPKPRQGRHSSSHVA
jgi:hypothetical protein